MAALPWAADAPPVHTDAWSDVRKLMLISVLGSRATGENAAAAPADDAEQPSEAAEDMTVDIEREPVTVKAGDRIEVQIRVATPTHSPPPPHYNDTDCSPNAHAALRCCRQRTMHGVMSTRL